MNETEKPTSVFQGQPAPKPFKRDPMAAARAAKIAKREAREAAEAKDGVAFTSAEHPYNPKVEAQAVADAPLPRRARKPFGTPTTKLSWPPREGYKRRWFNDSPGRVERALEAGYEHIKNPNGTPVSRVVDQGADGKGLSAYLMEIPEEWFDADFAQKQEALDETDKAIQRGALKDEETRDDGRYIPSPGIKVGVQRGVR